MAKVLDKSLLEINGKVGNFVVRNMNGKTFISLRPDEYKFSQTEKAKHSRGNFGITVKFARFINSQNILSAVWSSAKSEGVDSYRKIIKANLALASNSHLTENNIIVPSNKNSCIKDILYSPGKLNISLSQNNPKCASPKSRSLTIAVVIYFFNSKVPGYPDTHFHFLSRTIELTKNKKLKSIDIEFDSAGSAALSYYQDMIVYSSVISKQSCSSSFSKFFSIP